jgi:hypothetical protein
MTISIYHITVAEFARGMMTLAHILEKAAEYAKEKNIDVAEIPNWKLIDDMRPLSFQIQTASNTVKNSIVRISKAELPTWEDNETTLDQLNERIKKTLDLIKSIDASTWADKDSEEVTMKVRGSDMKFTALEYAQDFALPNFFFHVTTAYSILRMKGVPLGKRDFLSGGSEARAAGF